MVQSASAIPAATAINEKLAAPFVSSIVTALKALFAPFRFEFSKSDDILYFGL